MPNGDRPEEERTDEPNEQDEQEDSPAFNRTGRRGQVEGEFNNLDRFGSAAVHDAGGPSEREGRQQRDQQASGRPRSGAREGARQDSDGHIPVPHDEQSDTSRRAESPPQSGQGGQNSPREGRRQQSGQQPNQPQSNPEAGQSRRDPGPPRGTMGADGADTSRQPAPGQGGASPPPQTTTQGSSEQSDAPSRRTRETTARPTDDGDSGLLGGLFGSEETPDFQPYEWTQEDQTELEKVLLTMHHDAAPLLEVRPPRENEGMGAFEEILSNIHNVEIDGRHNVSTQHAHEVWYDDGQVQFHFQPADKPTSRTIKKQIRSAYPNAGVNEVVTTEETIRELFPLIQPGDYVSAADFKLKEPFYFSIRSRLAGEQDPFETDPYQYILTDMDQGSAQTASGERVHSDDVRILIQVVLQPARKDWSKGGLYGTNVANRAHDLKEKRLAERSPLGLGNLPLIGWMFKSWEEQAPNKRQRREAELVASVEGKSAFDMSVRVLAISPYEEFARQRGELIARDMETYYNSFTEQGLHGTPLEPGAIPQFVTQAATRRHEKSWSDRIARLNTYKPVQPIDAVAGVVHLPNDDINVPAVNWATQDVGPGVPSATRQGEEELADLYEDDGDDDEYERF